MSSPIPACFRHQLHYQHYKHGLRSRLLLNQLPISNWEWAVVWHGWPANWVTVRIEKGKTRLVTFSDDAGKAVQIRHRTHSPSLIALLIASNCDRWQSFLLYYFSISFVKKCRQFTRSDKYSSCWLITASNAVNWIQIRTCDRCASSTPLSLATLMSLPRQHTPGTSWTQNSNCNRTRLSEKLI